MWMMIEIFVFVFLGVTSIGQIVFDLVRLIDVVDGVLKVLDNSFCKQSAYFLYMSFLLFPH